MRNLLLFGAALVLLIASLYAPNLRADDPVSIADFAFRIELDRDSESMVLSCSKGCAWEKLTFDCGPASACSAEIDERGVITPARAN